MHTAKSAVGSPSPIPWVTSASPVVRLITQYPGCRCHGREVGPAFQGRRRGRMQSRCAHASSLGRFRLGRTISVSVSRYPTGRPSDQKLTNLAALDVRSMRPISTWWRARCERKRLVVRPGSAMRVHGRRHRSQVPGFDVGEHLLHRSMTGAGGPRTASGSSATSHPSLYIAADLRGLRHVGRAGGGPRARRHRCRVQDVVHSWQPVLDLTACAPE